MNPRPHDEPRRRALETRVRGLLADTMGRKKTKSGMGDKIIDPHAGFDSIAFMEFVVLLEDSFGLQIPDEDLKMDVFASVQTVAAYIGSKTDSSEAHTDGSTETEPGHGKEEGG